MATYALVVARFYEDLAARLEAGARAVLDEHGCGVEVFDAAASMGLSASAR
jgi:6,7-dimethyl-8-ribityllumazine synthase